MHHIPIIINSCKPFVDKAANLLIDSLSKSGVPHEYIIVVVGECDEDRVFIKNGIKYQETKTINIDLNGLLWLFSQYPTCVSQSGWFFYLHDTCIVTQDFWENVQRIYDQQLKDSNYMAGPIHKIGCNMGFYKYKVFESERVNHFLTNSPNFDLQKKQAEKIKGIHYEDHIFRISNSLILSDEMIVEETDTLYYSSKVPRKLYTYPIPGIIKIKANWEAKHEYCVDL